MVERFLIFALKPKSNMTEPIIVLCWILVGLEPCKGKASTQKLTLSRNNVVLEKFRIFPLHGERRNQRPTVSFPGKTPIFVLPFCSLPGNMTFRLNNVGLESLGFFPCMAQVQPMPNKELFPEVTPDS